MQPQTFAVVEDTTGDFVVDEPPQTKPQGGTPRETDARRLEQRQKQVDLGKNTLSYQRYAEMVPKWKRRRVGNGKPPYDPTTPDPHRVCSKRAFDGEVRAWRRALHRWDDAVGADEEIVDIKARLTLSHNPAQPSGPVLQANSQPVEAFAWSDDPLPQAAAVQQQLPQENRNAKRPAPGAPSHLEPSPRRRLNAPKGSFAHMVAVQASVPSPAGTFTSEVESFASTPESGELRPSTGRQPVPRSRLAMESLEPQLPEQETNTQTEAKNIFANWDDEDEVVI